jgi:hypothetical protein
MKRWRSHIGDRHGFRDSVAGSVLARMPPALAFAQAGREGTPLTTALRTALVILSLDDELADHDAFAAAGS